MNKAKEERKRIMLSPAGTDKDAPCTRNEAYCKYNRFDQCIFCGALKGHKKELQKQKQFQLVIKEK